MQSHLLILCLLLGGIVPSLFAVQIELKTEPKGSPISKSQKIPSPLQSQVEKKVEKSIEPVLSMFRLSLIRIYIKQGVIVKVISVVKAADGKDWSKIEFEGRFGYVKSSHLLSTK